MNQEELYHIVEHLVESGRHTLFLIDNIKIGNPHKLEELSLVIYPIFRNTIENSLNDINRELGEYASYFSSTNENR